MTPRERLAAHLLNMYWTGAGDAGRESTIINFLDVIEETKFPLSDALENGKNTKLSRANGYTVTMTDHFLMLADKILEDLNREKIKEELYREAARHIKDGIIVGLLKALADKGYSVEEMINVKKILDSPIGDGMLVMFVSNCPNIQGDLALDKLMSNWIPSKNT